MQIKKRKELRMFEFLEFFNKENIPKDTYDMFTIGESFDLYREPSDASITKGMICWADDAITTNDDDEEVYPEFSKNNGLEFFYSGERFIDVILSVLRQVEDPNIDIFIKALNYYDETDDFLDIET